MSSGVGVNFQGSVTETGPASPPTGAVAKEAILYVEKDGVKIVTKGGKTDVIPHERILASWVDVKDGFTCCFERELPPPTGGSSTIRFVFGSELDAVAMRQALRGAASAKATALEAAIIEAERKTKRPVLYVDYRPEVRRRVIKRVKAAGFAVEVAESSLAALKLWTENPTKFCVLMIEVLMPHTTGWDVARQIRAVEALREKELGVKQKGIPILAVSTGRSGDETAIDEGAKEGDKVSSLLSHCEAAGMDAYLDMNCSVKRLQWELCQFARKECASKDAPPPGTPAPQGVSHQLNLEDDEDEELDEALQEWKRRYVHQWSFRALFVPFIFARKSRRLFRRIAPGWLNMLILLFLGEGAKG